MDILVHVLQEQGSTMDIPARSVLDVLITTPIFLPTNLGEEVSIVGDLLAVDSFLRPSRNQGDLGDENVAVCSKRGYFLMQWWN